MSIKIVNLKHTSSKEQKQSSMDDVKRIDINNNLTYQVLFLIASTPTGITRNQVKNKFPTAWVILRRAVNKGWIVQKYDGVYNKFIITSSGLNKIIAMRQLCCRNN